MNKIMTLRELSWERLREWAANRQMGSCAPREENSSHPDCGEHHRS
jgi:hypothetical protein